MMTQETGISVLLLPAAGKQPDFSIPSSEIPLEFLPPSSGSFFARLAAGIRAARYDRIFFPAPGDTVTAGLPAQLSRLLDRTGATAAVAPIRTANGIPCRSEASGKPEPIRSALFSGTVGLHPAGWLIRRDALLEALEKTGTPEIGLFADTLLLTALEGTCCRLPDTGEYRVPGAEEPDILHADFRNYTVLAGQLFQDRAALESYHSFLYRLAVRELRRIAPRSGTNWRSAFQVLAEVMDNRLLYAALLEEYPDRFHWMEFARRPVRRRPVKKLAFFCIRMRLYGLERCAALLLEEFTRRGYEAVLFTNEPPTPQDYRFPASVKRIVLPADIRARRAELELIFRKEQIDCCVFFDHTEKWMPNDLLSSREAGIFTVAMEHNMFAYPLHIGKPELFSRRRAVYHCADVVTCLSRVDRECWHEQGILQCCYMPNPPTFALPDEPVGRLTAKTMLFIARLDAGKGAEQALEVLELVRRDHPDARLLMVGHCPSEDYKRLLYSRIAAAGLQDAVEITGFQSDVSGYFRQSSIHLMPSQMEGYPMTLTEAKAYHLPTVAFAMHYLEMLCPEYGSVQVGKDDTAGMAQAVSALFSDFDRLNELSRQAGQCLELFSTKIVMERWLAVFARLETGDDPHGLFAPETDLLRKLQAKTILTEELFCGLERCFTHPDLLRQIGRREYNSRIAGSRLLRLANELARLLDALFPAGSRRRKYCGHCDRILIRPPFLLLKKLYRCMFPWRDREE